MLGMVENNVENLKFIGRRDINMDENTKQIFDENDYYLYTPGPGYTTRYDHPYFNDAKELFRILIWAVFRETSFNKQK